MQEIFQKRDRADAGRCVMLVGDETKVRIIEMKDDGTAKGQNVSDGSMGVLRIKGKLKVW